MIHNMLYKILKYLALCASIYLVFRFVPNQSISNTDIIVITTIIVLLYILFENLCSVHITDTKYDMSQIEKSEMCSSVCSVKKETMADIPQASIHPASIQPTILQAVDTKKADMDEYIKLRDAADKAAQKLAVNITPTLNKSNDVVVNAADAFAKRAKIDADKGIERVGSRAQDDVLSDESNYFDHNHLPMGENVNSGSFEYGYSFMPPDKWYPQPPFPPVCVAEKKCPVCPVYTTGAPVDVKEWNDTRRVTQPDSIDTKMIKEKLNSGR